MDGKEFLGAVAQAATQLIAQVGVGVAVSDDLDGLLHAYGAMVGGEDHLEGTLR